jgi:proline dehydrogenase
MVTNEAMARAFAEEIKKTVKAFSELPYPRYVSVKLTQLGLDTSKALAEELLKEILALARAGDVFIRIDMEDSPRVDATLDIYRAMREAGFENVGIVLQAYLKRSEKDLEDLLPYRPNVRVVKGAYAEPPEVAYQDLPTIREKFKALARKNLEAGNKTAIATHDDALIRWAKAWTEEAGIPRDRYEFQFLYGVRPELQKKTAREGYTTRAYVPFGEAWYPYFSRRIAERPENALFVLRGLLKR